MIKLEQVDSKACSSSPHRQSWLTSEYLRRSRRNQSNASSSASSSTRSGRTATTRYCNRAIVYSNTNTKMTIWRVDDKSPLEGKRIEGGRPDSRFLRNF